MRAERVLRHLGLTSAVYGVPSHRRFALVRPGSPTLDDGDAVMERAAGVGAGAEDVAHTGAIEAAATITKTTNKKASACPTSARS